ARVLDPARALMADVDVIAPCAAGQVLDLELARRLPAWGVCGAANGVLASAEAGEALHGRGVLLVPDVVASAGAVIDGIGESVMGLSDRSALIDGLGDLARRVLERAEAEDRPASAVAQALAEERLGGRA
ncbi:MAG: amino acid dehydrogenase, partial [Deltaproteobacteria bacterium]|nr:amino acid dehydrogenase [Deltaproteobacteria bacterium]